MVRRFSLVAIFAFVLGLTSFSSRSQAQTASDRIWWHNLTDSSRNWNIQYKALSYGNRSYYGGECKVWVQNVVKEVSKKVVTLPFNNPYCDWQWYRSADVQEICSDRWDGVPFLPGQIIQAQVMHKDGSRGPHTMIVVGSNAVNITVIESNWDGNGIVKCRNNVKWADFKRNVIHYTLYQVK